MSATFSDGTEGKSSWLGIALDIPVIAQLLGMFAVLIVGFLAKLLGFLN
jgi:hypothetical protein